MGDSRTHDLGDFLTMDDLTEALHVPRGTLYYWRHAGKGPASFKAGRKVLYRRADVQKWIDELERSEGSRTGSDAADESA